MLKSSVAILEDDEPVRELWCRYVRRAEDFTLHHASASAEKSLPGLLADPPDLVVADWRLMGRMTGIELVARIKHSHPHLLAVVISGFKLPELPPDALLAGADSFLRKPVSGGELLDALRRLLAGHCEFSQPVVELLRARLRGPASEPPLPLGPLSPQEHRVLACLARNMSGKQAAEQLGLAWGTFLTYRDRAFKKLGAHSLLEAIQRLRAWPHAPPPFDPASACHTSV
jgi:DNA-binding NarL/FixJ family response regulator